MEYLVADAEDASQAVGIAGSGPDLVASLAVAQNSRRAHGTSRRPGQPGQVTGGRGQWQAAATQQRFAAISRRTRNKQIKLPGQEPHSARWASESRPQGFAPGTHSGWPPPVRDGLLGRLRGSAWHNTPCGEANIIVIVIAVIMDSGLVPQERLPAIRGHSGPPSRL